uniref:Orfan n=1 Tax=Caenorhabditis tropicalis TaxID=1561998 RepID=A0A1I7T092_9PELO
MTSFTDNESLTNYLIIDYDTEDDDDSDYDVFIANFKPENPRIKPKKVGKYLKKGFCFCFKTIKYIFLCCRCVIVWRCLWLFIFLLIGFFIFLFFYYDEIRKVVQFVYIVIDTSVHLYKRLENQDNP